MDAPGPCSSVRLISAWWGGTVPARWGEAWASSRGSFRCQRGAVGHRALPHRPPIQGQYQDASCATVSFSLVSSCRRRMPPDGRRMPPGGRDVSGVGRRIPGAWRRMPAVRRHMPGARRGIPGASRGIPGGWRDTPGGSRCIPPASGNGCRWSKSDSFGFRTPVFGKKGGFCLRRGWAGKLQLPNSNQAPTAKLQLRKEPLAIPTWPAIWRLPASQTAPCQTAPNATESVSDAPRQDQPGCAGTDPRLAEFMLGRFTRMDTAPPSKYSRQQLWIAWLVASACLAYAEFGVWSRVCACGYMTTSGIGTSAAFAGASWVGLVFGRRSPLLARVALAVLALIASLVLAYHVADAFYFSPHSPFPHDSNAAP